jgi:ammonia channel protein AmtB
VAWGISIGGTLVLLFLADKIIGPHLTAEQETTGLNLTQHAEEGYDLNG